MQVFCKLLLKRSIGLPSNSKKNLISFQISKYVPLKSYSERIFKTQTLQQNNAARNGAGAFTRITAGGWFLLIIPVTTFGLGCWQVKRKLWKEQLIKDLRKQTEQQPVDLTENEAKINEMEYCRVKTCGRFLHEKEMLMGPRSLISPHSERRKAGLFTSTDGNNGYLVITPFLLSKTGDIILVNRGWVSRNQTNPNSRKEGQIIDEVELVGIVRKGEKKPNFAPDHKGNFFFYRDLEKMCASTGAKPIFIDATYETSVLGGPIGGQTKVTLRNEHLSYLITWFSLTVCTTYMWYRQILRRK